VWTRACALNPGIAARLAASLVAVAVLAVSANLMVEHGTSIIQIARTRAAPPTLRNTLPTVQRAVGSGISSPPIIQSALSAGLLEAEPLEAFSQFERAVLLRAQADTPENNKLLRATRSHLEDEVGLLLRTAREATLAPQETEALPAQMRKAHATAAQLIELSDARRASLLSYRNHFENVDAALKQTLDHTWRIFGRIIARESLVTLSRELDDIRRNATRLSFPGVYEPSVLLALQEAENAFSTTLDHHGSDLSRSQGTPWVVHLREEFSEVVSSRIQLASLGQQGAQAFNAFERSCDLLKSSVRSISRAAPQTPAPAKAQIEIASTVKSALDASLTAPVTTLPTPSITSSTTLTRSTFSGLDRALLATLSGAVLLVLLVISVRTVRSVVRPVRAFLITSERLAKGDVAARFPRGGIRELDALAISLNQMASTLETAQAITREHQGALELRIEERTRQFEQLARSDLLTGLPNTRHLMQHLEQVIQDATASGQSVAVVLFDLDGFKNVNDTMGHSFGDGLLRVVAQRLALVIGPAGFAARMGGDEFAIVLTGTEAAEQVNDSATAIIRAFRAPLTVEGRDLLITVSGGISLYPKDGTTAEVLLKAADAALFRAKDQGRDQLSRFTPELLQSASEKFNIAQGLRRALDRGELELVFQPELSLDTGAVHSVEALLRWRLPDGRRLSPMQFLTTAQESGLINRIGDWVLHSAVETAAAWHQGPWPQVRVAINVSANQLLSGTFPQRVQELLQQHRLPAQCIEIELTETVLQTGAACIDALRELRDIGLGIALDDFGTGFSSLASLQHLPLTRVKLDQTLIAAIDRDARALAIANAITELCARLGLSITAEGIERSTQLALLLEHRAIHLQGYLFCVPIEPDAVAAMVASMPDRFHSLIAAALMAAETADSEGLSDRGMPRAAHGKSRYRALAETQTGHPE
jgi:diguanylate cyclase (GGDEF)-like protein